jgi:hypothetical protein
MASLQRAPVDATCFPLEGSSALPALVEEACRRREALFIATALRQNGLGSSISLSSELSNTVDEFAHLDPKERREITGHPVFALALDEFLRTVISADEEPGPETEKLVAAYQRTQAALHSRDVPRIDSTELRRWDTDPLIVERAPPTYTFPPVAERRRRAHMDAYELADFAKFGATAMDRLGVVWPELRQQFSLVVRVLVQIPDAPYRSASAVRYRGVVFLSSDDVTLMDIEESLVHEFGHQVLYELMAARPLLVDGAAGSYRLPWSGSRRDFYGYVHAFYIYLLLALYLERALRQAIHDADELRPLFRHIVGGLEEARHDFELDARFTRAGAGFMRALQGELDLLEARLAREQESIE